MLRYKLATVEPGTEMERSETGQLIQAVRYLSFFYTVCLFVCSGLTSLSTLSVISRRWFTVVQLRKYIICYHATMQQIKMKLRYYIVVISRHSIC